MDKVQRRKGLQEGDKTKKQKQGNKRLPLRGKVLCNHAGPMYV